MKDDKLYLIHIRECIDKIDRYTGGRREQFFASTMVQDAVLRNLQTLAESTQKISDELKGQYPQIDWRGISGFRNLLVHNYLGVDVPLVWQIVETDLSGLKSTVEMMLTDLP